MRTLSKEFNFPSSFFKTTAAQWINTPHEDQSVFTRSYILRNIIFCIIISNVINFLYINLTLHFSEIDVVQLLKTSPMAEKSSFSYQLESVLHGIYLKNEDLYLKNINDTTIVTAPIIKFNNKRLKIKLTERLYGKYKRGYRFSTNILRDIGSSRLFTNKELTKETLSIVLNRLYHESKHLDVQKVINKVLTVITLVLINKIIILSCSISMIFLFVTLHYLPKDINWHYFNITSLFAFDFICSINVLIIIVGRFVVSVFDWGSVYLILEFISFLILNFVFLQTHKLFMTTIYLEKQSNSSSVYSDKLPKSIQQQIRNGHEEEIIDQVSSSTNSKKSLQVVLPIPVDDLNPNFEQYIVTNAPSPTKQPYMPYQSISKHIEHPSRRKSTSDVTPFLKSSSFKMSNLTTSFDLSISDTTESPKTTSNIAEQKEIVETPKTTSDIAKQIEKTDDNENKRRCLTAPINSK
ncbi:unnamed protein product [Candida verbasci]|uniref:Uncharacterized protein n=1 Tax=Candida verbasci TaxID=1227364 RepID=A0A9W4XKA2_9ASCO|nr:unnamed protein product [Candida verbasci]